LCFSAPTAAVRHRLLNAISLAHRWLRSSNRVLPRAPFRETIEKKYLAAPNVMGVIVAR